MAYSALLIASYVYAAANPRVVWCPDAQDTHGGGYGKHRLCQSFDWAAAVSGSTRTLLTMGYTAGNSDGGTASSMVEICRVNLQFAAARRGMAPLGAIFHSQPSSTPLSTASLRCCFSVATCVQVVTGAFGQAHKLLPPVAETSAKSGACARACLALAGAYGRFQTRLALAGVQMHILACLLLVYACRWLLARSARLRSYQQV